MEFKKSDSNEIERTLAIVVAFILLAIPIFFMLGWFVIIPTYSKTKTAEIIVTMGGAILFIFLIMYFFKRENRHVTVLDLVVLLVGVSLILSTIFAQSVSLAVSGAEFTCEGTLVNLSYLIMLISCSVIRNPKYRKWIYAAIVLVGAFEIFMAVMQSVVQYQPLMGDMVVEEGEASRAYGSLMNQNPYGALMALFAGLEYGLLVTSEKKKWKMFHGLMALGCTYSVILSGTRGAMVGLVFSCLFFLVILLVFGKKKGESSSTVWKITAMMAGCMLVAILLVFLTSHSIIGDAINRVSNDVEAGGDALGSGRIGIWRAAWGEFLEHPIFGVGVSNFRYMIYNDDGLTISYVVHNEYLDILVSHGVIGFVAYIAMQLYIFLFAMKKLWKGSLRENKETFALLIAFVAYMATAFFGWRIIYLTPYFYVITGLMISRHESKQISFGKRH